ncbi:MAG: NUDIX hydrolase [Flavobacteriaceae bacterium]
MPLQSLTQLEPMTVINFTAKPNNLNKKMDELIDLVNQNGNPTGQTALKSVIHKKGYYHNTGHLWLYTPNGQILLAQRSTKKAICPLLWDISVAGHIDAGETIENGILRETQEELGLTLAPEDLTKIGVFSCFQTYPNGIKDFEFHHTYIAQLNVPITQLKPQEDEVEAIKLISFSQFQWYIDHIGTDNHFIPSNKAYYIAVLNAVKAKHCSDF